MNTPTLALSIRQPWAWLILHAGKDIENREWFTRFRGRVWIHASKTMTRGEYHDALDWMVFNRRIPLIVHEPGFDELPRGGIVGSVEIADCVTRSDSPWFCGPHGLVLRDPQPCEFMPCRGALGFFKPAMPAPIPCPADLFAPA